MIVVVEEKNEVVVGDVDVNPEQILTYFMSHLTSTHCQSRMVTESWLAGIGFPDTFPRNFHYFFSGKVNGKVSGRKSLLLTV
jgi:hypothetical protein